MPPRTPSVFLEVTTDYEEEYGVFEDPGVLSRGRHASLLASLTADVVAGIATSLVVSPFVTIVDKSLTSNVSGRESMMQSLSAGVGHLFRNPILFMSRPSFFAVFTVFAGTYVVNNTVETACIHNQTSAVKPKFLLGSATNVGLNLYKDILFTRWYAAVAPRPVPAASLALFALRDTMTVSTSFVLPPLASPYLQSEPLRMSRPSADFAAQLALPCAVQLVSVPIHLLSLDLYNNPHHGVRERVQLVRSGYWNASVGRVLRTIPGFGVGGVVNRAGRHKLNAFFSEKLEVFESWQAKAKI
ncbi:hypothetical protein BC830DRAFT_1125455 [Chytriomyces sp. MP71]|nr:hypothetical protein BC830DRAFT_1125455 [Chytriomyces sp. MP71]